MTAMPTYDYTCESCGYRFERSQSITARTLCKCPVCGEKKLKRLIGVGSAVLFKGNGFYQTDYRSEGYKKAKESEKKTTTPAKDAAKKEPETKSKEPKPSKKDKPAPGEKK